LTRYSISLINGDGIGPDLANSGKELLEKISDYSEIKFDIVNVAETMLAQTQYRLSRIFHLIALKNQTYVLRRLWENTRQM
jgi:isocitrate/isopropylmalate dehydrogenase